MKFSILKLWYKSSYCRGSVDTLKEVKQARSFAFIPRKTTLKKSQRRHRYRDVGLQPVEYLLNNRNLRCGK